MSSTVLTRGILNPLTWKALSNKQNFQRCFSVQQIHKFPKLRHHNQKSLNVIVSRSFSLETLSRFSASVFSKICESDLMAFVRKEFLSFHAITGIPWWCTIILSATVVKISTLPLRIYQIKLLGLLDIVKKEMDVFMKMKHKEMVLRQREHFWTPEKTKSVFFFECAKHRRALIQKYGCQKSKIILLSFVDMPLWFFMSCFWRVMSYGFADDITSSLLLVSQMTVEGTFWCPNLQQPDPTYILSLLIFLSNMTLVQISVIHSRLKKNNSKLFKILSYLSRGFGLFAAVISSYLPAGVGVFWVSSTVLNIARDIFLLSPRVRVMLKLPFETVTNRNIFEAFRKTFEWIKLKGNKSDRKKPM